MALLIEEATNQTESQQIKSNVGFWWEGKTGSTREKNLKEQNREPTNLIHIWERVRKSNPRHCGETALTAFPTLLSRKLETMSLNLNQALSLLFLPLQILQYLKYVEEEK